MTAQLPESLGIAVDPSQVSLELRQMHAQQLDALMAENATLKVALRDSQATVAEQRVRMEEMGNELAQLRERVSRPLTPAQRAVKPERPERPEKATEQSVNAASAKT